MTPPPPPAGQMPPSQQLAGLRAVLLDLSGTLHVGSTTTPDAVAALQRLRKASFPLRFCSNTTKDSSSDLVARLRKIGFELREEELFTSLSAARQIVITRKLRPYLILSQSAKRDFEGLQPDDIAQCDTVVVGLAPEALNYSSLNTAFRILKREPLTPSSSAPPPGLRTLLATHTGTVYGDTDGSLSLGPGPFVHALAEASGVEPEVIGKPTRGFFEVALRSLESEGVLEEEWTDVAIVGDDWKNDLSGGATELGLRRILVKTGKYRTGDENKAGEVDGVWDNFASFVDDLLAAQR